MPVQDHFEGRTYAAAFKDLDRALDSEPTVTYRKLRDHWLAAQFRRKESEALPSPWREFCLSSLEWAAGAELESLSLLHRASLLAPRYFWMRYYVAEILLRRLDMYELAREEIQAVIQRCPWLWEARCLWTENLMALGHPDPLKAVRALQVPEGSRPAFLAWRGALELWSGEYDQAVRDLDAAAALDNPDALCWRGGALTKLGRLTEAKRDLDRLLAMDPHDPEGLVWRGELHRLMGLTREALEDLADVTAISGDKPWAHVNRALILLSQGDLLGAYRDFVQLYPPTNHLEGVSVCPFSAERLRSLLDAVLAAGRGCRRSDPHLNAGWMRAAGFDAPRGAGARFAGWARAAGLEFRDADPPRVAEARVLEILDRQKPARR